MRRRVPFLLATLLLGLVPLAAPASAGGGGCHDAEIRQERATTVRMEAMCFRPGVVHVDVGDTLVVVNRDPLAHNLYGQDWYAGDLAPGEETTRTFEEPGVYAFTCTLHPGMSGAVVVGDGGDVELAAASPIGADRDGAGDGGGLALALTLGGVVALAGTFAGGRALGRRRPATR